MFFWKEYRISFRCFGTSVGYLGKSVRSVSKSSYKFFVFRKEYHFGFGFFVPVSGVLVRISRRFRIILTNFVYIGLSTVSVSDTSVRVSGVW